MTQTRKTWREKRFIRQEDDIDNDGSQNTTKEGNKHDAEVGDKGGTQSNMGALEVNVFTLHAEFHALELLVTLLNLKAEWVVFEKPARAGEHMKPFYIKGHLVGKPVGCMMVDRKTNINIMPLALFEKLGHSEHDLKQTNISLSGFSSEPTEDKGIMSKELTVGSNTMPTTFFVVDVTGRYNVLLGRDWIHANGCIPSTLHQCAMQCVGDSMEVVQADDMACEAITECEVDVQRGR
jgi:hypothetical protein